MQLNTFVVVEDFLLGITRQTDGVHRFDKVCRCKPGAEDTGALRNNIRLISLDEGNIAHLPPILFPINVAEAEPGFGVIAQQGTVLITVVGIFDIVVANQGIVEVSTAKRSEPLIRLSAQSLIHFPAQLHTLNAHVSGCIAELEGMRLLADTKLLEQVIND